MCDRPSWGEVDLPFGETRVTVATLEQYIARETAETVLAVNGVSQPEDRITAFIEQIPALLRWPRAERTVIPLERD